MPPIRFANISGTHEFHKPQDVIQSTFINTADQGGQLGSYAITGFAAAHSEMSATLNVSGNLNFNKIRQKNLYNKFINGTAKRTEIGQVQDLASSVAYADQLVRPPSWTQKPIGLDFSHVISIISSSNHESMNLNAYLSGTSKLENTFNAITGTNYYSKVRRNVKLIYKLSASVNLPMLPISSTISPSIHESNARTLGDSNFIAISGCFRANNIFDPSVFEIDVPDYGKIKDIKVWVEFIHDHRGGTGHTSGTVFLASGCTGTLAVDLSHGLQSVVVALRSPNVTFPFAHPLWNAESVKKLGKRSFPGIFEDANTSVGPDWTTTGTCSDETIDGGSQGNLPSQFRETPEIFKNSFLLWSGHSVEYDLFDTYTKYSNTSVGSNRAYELPYYHEFDTDIDMRTIFTDSSKNLNPRNLTPLMSSSGDTLISSVGFQSVTGTSEYKAPFKTANQYSWGVAMNVTGANFPWMRDTRIPAGNFVGRAGSTLPTLPSGWLTAAGGVANTNEFPTTGSQVGPDDINAVYPLLDDIYSFKIYQSPLSSSESINSTVVPEFRLGNIGFRPGLRGTEVNGKWKLMVGLTADFNGVPVDPDLLGMVVRRRNGIWFRQFRLEFIVDQGEELNVSPQIIRRHKRPDTVMFKPTEKSRIQFMSGSSGWDRGINLIYAKNQEEYGRTIGITDDPGLNISDFAVFTRFSGTLWTEHSSSISASYLNNEFGTPYLPLSYAEPASPLYTFDEFEKVLSKALINELVNKKPTLKQTNSLKSVLNRNRYKRSTLSLRQDIINKYNDVLYNSGSSVDETAKDLGIPSDFFKGDE